MRNNRIFLAKTIKKYVRLGIANKSLGEYEKISIIKGFSRSASEFYDLVAVSDMIKVVCATGREEDLRIFVALYMGRGMRLVSLKSDVSSNALRLSMRTHQDVRTIYRRAAYIEELYFKIRNNYKTAGR